MGMGRGKGGHFRLPYVGMFGGGRARVGRVTEELDGMQDVARIVATI